MLVRVTKVNLTNLDNRKLSKYLRDLFKLSTIEINKTYFSTISIWLIDFSTILFKAIIKVFRLAKTLRTNPFPNENINCTFFSNLSKNHRLKKLSNKRVNIPYSMPTLALGRVHT